MLVQQSKLLLPVVIAGVIGWGALGLRAQTAAQTPATTPSTTTPAQTPATQTGQKNWKDRAEYDLYDSITKDTTPATRLQKLDEWKQKYPTTDFIKERRTLYLTTYAQLNRPQDAVNAAKEILADDPNDFTAQYYIVYFTQALAGNNPTPDVLDQGEKAANSVLSGLDTQFAAAKKPASMSDADWTKARQEVEALADSNLGWIAMQRKQWDTAEGDFQKTLGINPNSAQVDYWMGTSILGEKKPERQSEALFYFARAAAYDGPGSLPPEGRKSLQDYLTKAYTTYHGSTEGLDALMAAAKASPTPTGGYHIVDKNELEANKIKQEQEAEKANPQLALWRNLKTELTGANGQQYFDSSMKGTLVPTLSGKVVSMTPALNPKTVVLAIEDGTTPDATLQFETALHGKVAPGTVLSFEGTPVSYSASPFMVTFSVDHAKLHGWPAAPAPVRRRARP